MWSPFTKGDAGFPGLRQALRTVNACARVSWPLRDRQKDVKQVAILSGVARRAHHDACNADLDQSRRWRCAGKTVYASTVNVRDKVAGFIVSLAGMSDRWDKDASPALLRCRNGLGRSSDPKVVALRQAVLEKCMAFKGPPPNLGPIPYQWRLDWFSNDGASLIRSMKNPDYACVGARHLCWGYCCPAGASLSIGTSAE